MKELTISVDKLLDHVNDLNNLSGKTNIKTHN